MKGRKSSSKDVRKETRMFGVGKVKKKFTIKAFMTSLLFWDRSCNKKFLSDYIYKCDEKEKMKTLGVEIGKQLGKRAVRGTSTARVHQTRPLHRHSLIITSFDDFLPSKYPYLLFENNTGRTDGQTRPIIETRRRI